MRTVDLLIAKGIVHFFSKVRSRQNSVAEPRTLFKIPVSVPGKELFFHFTSWRTDTNQNKQHRTQRQSVPLPFVHMLFQGEILMRMGTLSTGGLKNLPKISRNCLDAWYTSMETSRGIWLKDNMYAFSFLMRWSFALTIVCYLCSFVFIIEWNSCTLGRSHWKTEHHLKKIAHMCTWLVEAKFCPVC